MPLKRREYEALDAYVGGALSIFEKPEIKVDDKEARICQLLHTAKQEIEQNLYGKMHTDESCPQPSPTSEKAR